MKRVIVIMCLMVGVVIGGTNEWNWSVLPDTIYTSGRTNGFTNIEVRWGEGFCYRGNDIIGGQYLIEERVVTNWVTTSKTIPETPKSSDGCTYAIYMVTTLNQVGVVKSQKVAVMKWKGKRVEAILEEVELSERPIRGIPEGPMGNFPMSVITPCSVVGTGTWTRIGDGK